MSVSELIAGITCSLQVVFSGICVNVSVSMCLKDVNE